MYLDIVILVYWVTPRSAGLSKRGQRAAVAARSPQGTATAGHCGEGSARLTGGTIHDRSRIGGGPECSSP